MAKKEEKSSMVGEFAEFLKDKNIDKNTMTSVLVESFQKVLSTIYGTEKNFQIVLNPDKGDVEITQELEIVADGEVENPTTQISLSEARADNDPDAEIGETHARNIVFADFGRRAILNLRQTLQSRILELQNEAIYRKFNDLKGEIISGEVYQTWGKETLLIDNDRDKNELILPRTESIPSDRFRKGETVRAVVLNVENKNGKPKIYVSRTSGEFLRRLFEIEVPEIHDGLITIHSVARIPGERAKIAVESYDDRIDPVGACVGVKGSRIHGIVRELRNENIDVISYTSDPKLFIQRALSPAHIKSISINEAERKAEVYLRPEEVSMAIGKGGSNIKLASMLTGYEIDVFRDTEGYVVEEDVDLDAFNDDIEEWIIEALKGLGYQTAKAVLRAPREFIVEKADLEEETVDEVLEILRQEFEND
ncbi:MAG: transcription termination/antitermination protein NusA [Muribaculaceae bacterium]|nr:transcription termination/antitermination protein NusA [Muribaculaceae bacterium]